MRHLDEGTIHAWLDGALNEEKAKKAEEHAARCTQCAVAVADARGYIAASSRILSALDDVPRGVVPKTAPSAPALSSIKASRPMAPARQFYQPWMLKAAASVVVVATTGLLIARSRPSAPTGFSAAATRDVGSSALPESFPAAPAPAAIGSAAAPPTTNSPLAKAKAAGGAGATESLAYAGKPASDAKAAGAVMMQEPAAAPARELAVRPVEASRLDSAAPAPVANQVATVAPKISIVSAATGNGVTAKRSIGAQDATLPPGMRIVSEQTVTAEARVVQKRVYEVSPGVEVTYSIFEPAPERANAAPSAANDSGAEAKDESDVGVNTIKWSDSTGTDFILSGRLPLDSLRVIRSKLTTTHAK